MKTIYNFKVNTWFKIIPIIFVFLFSCTRNGLQINWHFYSEQDLKILYQVFENIITKQDSSSNHLGGQIESLNEWLIEQEVTYHLAIKLGLLENSHYLSFYKRAKESFTSKVVNLYWSKTLQEKDISMDAIKKYYQYNLDHKKTFNTLKKFKNNIIGTFRDKKITLFQLIKILEIEDSIKDLQNKNFEFFIKTIKQFEESFLKRLALKEIFKNNFISNDSYKHIINFEVATDFLKSKYLDFKKGFYPVDVIPIEVKDYEILEYIAKQNKVSNFKKATSNWVVFKKNKKMSLKFYRELQEKKNSFLKLVNQYKNSIYLKKINHQTKASKQKINFDFSNEVTLEENDDHKHDLFLIYDTEEEELHSQIDISIQSKSLQFGGNIYYQEYEDEYIFVIQILNIDYKKRIKNTQKPLEIFNIKSAIRQDLLHKQYKLDRFDIKKSLYINSSFFK